MAQPAPARPAATVILLRRGSKHSEAGLELLMLQRGSEARFMPGSWVFAGGAVEDADHQRAAAEPTDGVDTEELAHRICGARELGEEAGIELGADALLPWSRWVTPEVAPIRFDTRFYVGLAPPHATPKPDGMEMSDARWVTPGDALDEHEAGRFELPFPTRKHVEELSRFADADAVLTNAAERPVVPLTPKVVGTEESFEIILPGEPGYDEAP